MLRRQVTCRFRQQSTVINAAFAFSRFGPSPRYHQPYHYRGFGDSQTGFHSLSVPCQVTEKRFSSSRSSSPSSSSSLACRTFQKLLVEACDSKLSLLFSDDSSNSQTELHLSAEMKAFLFKDATISPSSAAAAAAAHHTKPRLDTLKQIRRILVERLIPQTAVSVQSFAKSISTKAMRDQDLAVRMELLDYFDAPKTVTDFKEGRELFKRSSIELTNPLKQLAHFCEFLLPKTFEKRFKVLCSLSKNSDTAFGIHQRVLAPDSSKFDEVCRRHNDALVDNFWRYTPSLLEEALTSSVGATDEWPIVGYIRSALVLSGPSGSGKTIESVIGSRLLVERKYKNSTGTTVDDVYCLYFDASDILPFEKQNLKVDDRSKRDEKVMRKVNELVCRSLHLPSDSSCLESSLSNKTHLVVVFDDICECPIFLRSLCSIVSNGKAAMEIHKLVFGTSVNCAHTRVHFVAAGTGVISIMFNGVCWRPNKYATVHLPPTSVVFRDLLLQNKRFLVGPDSSSATSEQPITLYDQLIRLAFPTAKTMRDGEMPMSTVQNLVAEFTTNARCAAIFIQQVLDQRDAVDKLNWGNVETLNFHMYGWLTASTLKYFSMNGLGAVRDPVRVLLFAMTVSALRIPVLPDNMEFLKKNQLWKTGKVPERQAASDDAQSSDNEHRQSSLSHVLCTSCGISVDRIIRHPEKVLLDYYEVTLSDVLAGRFCPLQRGDDITADKDHLVLRRDSARYEFAPHFLAMLRLQLTSTRDIIVGWDGFERRIGELCMMLSGTSSFTNALLKSELKSKLEDPSQQIPRNRSAKPLLIEDFTEAVHRNDDRLYKLKHKWLRYDSSRWEIVEVKTLSLRETTIDRITKNMVPRCSTSTSTSNPQIAVSNTSVGDDTDRNNNDTGFSDEQVEENMMRYHEMIYDLKNGSNENDDNSAETKSFDYLEFLLSKQTQRIAASRSQNIPQASPQESRVLVMHTILNEPFADVIVLSPMKVVLLQCTQHRADRWGLDLPNSIVDLSKEFFNMGVADSGQQLEDIELLDEYHSAHKNNKNKKNTGKNKKAMKVKSSSSHGTAVASRLRHRLRQRLFLLHLRRMCAVDPYDATSIEQVRVCAGVVVESSLVTYTDLVDAALLEFKKSLAVPTTVSHKLRLHDFDNFDLGLFIYTCPTLHGHSPMYPFEYDDKKQNLDSKCDRVISTLYTGRAIKQ